MHTSKKMGSIFYYFYFFLANVCGIIHACMVLLITCYMEENELLDDPLH
jgi:hypothetical protein